MNEHGMIFVFKTEDLIKILSGTYRCVDIPVNGQVKDAFVRHDDMGPVLCVVVEHPDLPPKPRFGHYQRLFVTDLDLIT